MESFEQRVDDLFDEDATVTTAVEKSDETSIKERKKTAHTDPGWLECILKNFKSEIINVCSSKTKKAVADNVFIDVSNHYSHKASSKRIFLECSKSC